MRERAVVVGAGAIGIVLADALATAGLEVVVLGGRPVDRLVLDDGEARREHAVEHLAAWDGRPHDGPVVVAVKAYDTAAAGPLIAGAAAAASAVVVAQNGVEHRERVAPFAGSAPVVPLLAYTPAERVSPGRAMLTRPGGREVVVPDDGPSRRIAALLRRGGLAAGTVSDFAGEAWAKLVLNTASMTTTTLTDRPLAVLHEPAVAAFAEALLAEVAAAARAAGARLDPRLPRQAIEWLQALPPGTTTSMLQDRRAGRPLEWDAIHGAALRAADRAGLPVPLLRAVVALLAAL